MKKILATDNALRVLSLLSAIAIWIYIAIVMDPAIQVTVRDLPIQFVGQEYLNDRGYAIINESATTVTIKVKGSRKKMGNNDMDTIIAKANVSEVNAEGNHNVPIEIIIPFENQGIQSQSLYTVDVNVEPIAQKTLDLQIKTTGTLANNYIAGDIEINPKKVVVRGAQSAVEKISKAVATLDFKGEDVDIDKDIPITFYNENEKAISALDAISKRVKADIDKTTVHCPVLKIIEAKAKANFGWQELPEDFKYKIEPSTLYIYGNDAKVYTITEISTHEISVRELKDRKKLKVKLDIPYGVKVFGDVSEVEISL